MKNDYMKAAAEDLKVFCEHNSCYEYDEDEKGHETLISVCPFLEKDEVPEDAHGRALGFVGIGSVDSIASGDEVNKAINKGKELDSVIGESMAADLAHDLMQAGQSPDVVVKYNKVADLSQLTVEQYNNVVKRYLKK